MLGFWTFISLAFMTTFSLLKAHPTNEISKTSKRQLEENDIEQHSTTETANQTNILNSAWHKFSNIFYAETTTEPELETRKEVLMPEDRLPPSGREENDRDFRITPVDFSRQARDTWEEKFDEGSLHPVHQQEVRMRRSAKFGPFNENEAFTSEVRAEKQQYKQKKFKMKRISNVFRKKVPVIIEEFDQGETEGGRLKRFKDSKDSPDWKTEKIVVESDPVENIDNANYIEETKNKNFPFFSFSIQPIIVEDSFTFDTTIMSEQELPPLKVAEY